MTTPELSPRGSMGDKVEAASTRSRVNHESSGVSRVSTLTLDQGFSPSGVSTLTGSPVSTLTGNLGFSPIPVSTLTLDQVETLSHREAAGVSMLTFFPTETLMKREALPLAWVDDVAGGRALHAVVGAWAWLAGLGSRLTMGVGSWRQSMLRPPTRPPAPRMRTQGSSSYLHPSLPSQADFQGTTQAPPIDARDRYKLARRLQTASQGAREWAADLKNRGGLPESVQNPLPGKILREKSSEKVDLPSDPHFVGKNPVVSDLIPHFGRLRPAVKRDFSPLRDELDGDRP